MIIEVPLFVFILLIVCIVGMNAYLLWFIYTVSKAKKNYERYLEEKYGNKEQK